MFLSLSEATEASDASSSMSCSTNCLTATFELRTIMPIGFCSASSGAATIERMPDIMMLSEAAKRWSVAASNTSAAMPLSSTSCTSVRESGMSVDCPGSARVAAW